MRFLLVVLGLGLAAPAVRAETILVNSSQGGVFLVDVETLAVERLTTGPQLFDIAVSPKGQILGISSSGRLWRIDPQGAHWPLGQVRQFLNALAFDPGGTLVGAGNQRLVQIRTEPVGTRPVGDYPGFFSSGDVAFDADGTLYATGSPGPQHMDTLFRLRPGGALEPVGPIGFRNVYGLVWSVRLRALFGLTEARALIVIDPDSGTGRIVGMLDFPGRGYGAAAYGAGPATIGRLDRPSPVSERHGEVSFP